VLARSEQIAEYGAVIAMTEISDLHGNGVRVEPHLLTADAVFVELAVPLASAKPLPQLTR
jgi:hypothetical protein